MKYSFKSAAMVLACAGAMLATTNTFAANWLMLQGTEPDAAAPRVKMWGFVQAQYQKDDSDANAGGAYIPPKLIGPNLTSQSAFNVNRARIGLRGTGMPIDPKVNYFMLLELGNNGITAAEGGGAYITDASITLNHIKGARIRMGTFKAPMAEEGLAAIHVFDYINFTSVSNQLMLERFPNARDGSNAPPSAIPATGLNQFDRGVGAFRDTGVQVFDAFRNGDWEHSYAIMIGNGNGLNFGDNDDEKDTYVYFSTEKIFAGKGPFRQGVKMFAWSQSGSRQLDQSADGVYNPVEYDRDRAGVGIKYLKKPWRATFEYMTGEGMIFVGPDKALFDINAPGGAGDGTLGEASGFYLEGGYYIPGTAWSVDLRYDVYNRLEDDTLEMEFATTTLGANYKFNKKTRLTLGISDTAAEAINFATGVGPNANLDGVGSRFAVQVTHIF